MEKKEILVDDTMIEFYLDDDGMVFFDLENKPSMFKESAAAVKEMVYSNYSKFEETDVTFSDDLDAEDGMLSLYSFNVLIWLIRDSFVDPDLVFSLYDRLTLEGYDLNISSLLEGYFLKRIQESKQMALAFLDSYSDLIQSLQKEGKKDSYSDLFLANRVFEFGFFSEFEEYMKSRFHQKNDLFDARLLNFYEEFRLKTADMEDIYLYASAFFYEMIKKRPIGDMSDAYACASLLAFLKEKGILFENGESVLLEGTLLKAMDMIKRMDDQKKEENHRKVKEALFEEGYVSMKPSYEVLLESYKRTKDDNELFEGVVDFVRQYRTSIGFYDYFKGKVENQIEKLHYGCEIQRVSYNHRQSMEKKKLCFDVFLGVNIEAPNMFEDWIGFVEDRYDEVVDRAPEFLTKDMDSGLNKILKKYKISKKEIGYGIVYQFHFFLNDLED